MNKFLLTWYGLTDFRAALGLESTNGPVLSALLSGDYTDVIVLGFTDQDKQGVDDSLFRRKRLDLDLSDPGNAKNFIAECSNTDTGHNCFVQWLKQQLLSVDKEVKVNFKPISLRHLNDTEAIYQATNDSLDEVSALEGKNLVTLFLSPGTPVMAFVWAFAALRHPKLKKRLLASSQPGAPPEYITLPSEWLEWYGKQAPSNPIEAESFDVIVHLFGEQRTPSLLGINQFTAGEHIFVTSKQYPAKVMKKFIGDRDLFEIPIDPYDPENVRTKILDVLNILPPHSRIGFNLTGGTKLMYAGAMAACRNINATPFYFDNKNNKTIFLNDFSSVPTKSIDSVETFINLNGDEIWISKPGNWDQSKNSDYEKRNRLTFHLWDVRRKLSRLYKDLTKLNDLEKPFSMKASDISVSLSKDLDAEITLGDKHYHFQHWPDFARYLSGGWFEEYTYLCLAPLLDSGVIRDLRLGLEISIDEKGYQHFLDNARYQELDVTFTDGKSLYVVECKAGNVTSDQVMKLQNIVRHFGGISGQGIFSCCFEPSNKVVNKKISDAKNLHLVDGKGVVEKIEAIVKNNNSD